MTEDTRLALRTEIEFTREKFHRMLVTVPEESLQLVSKNPTWTNGEVLYRISISPLFVRSILKRNSGRWSNRLLPKLVTGPLIEWGNEKLIQASFHNLTRLSLAKDFEYHCALALEVLDQVSDDDFEKIVVVSEPDALLPPQVTIEQLFHYIKNHFNLYRKQINSGQ